MIAVHRKENETTYYIILVDFCISAHIFLNVSKTARQGGASGKRSGKLEQEDHKFKSNPDNLPN